MMKGKIFILIISISCFISCSLDVSRIWKNEDIDKDIQSQINRVNKRLFTAIVGKDVSTIKSLSSDKFLEKFGNNLDSLTAQISSSFKANSYRKLDEFYLSNISPENNFSIPSGIGNDNDYIIKAKGLNKEMYISLLLPNGLTNDLLITIVYGKYKNDWKIDFIQFGPYNFAGKTAPDYYNLAKECYNKSYLIDAIDNITMASACLKPNEFWEYKKEKEIKDFYQKIVYEANTKYKLPFSLANIESNPKILKIYPELVKEDVYPMVLYLTKINLKDSFALRSENNKIKKEIGLIFHGINENNKFVLYTAVNELPNQQKPVAHFEFIAQTKK